VVWRQGVTCRPSARRERDLLVTRRRTTPRRSTATSCVDGRCLHKRLRALGLKRK